MTRRSFVVGVVLLIVFQSRTELFRHRRTFDRYAMFLLRNFQYLIFVQRSHETFAVSVQAAQEEEPSIPLEFLFIFCIFNMVKLKVAHNFAVKNILALEYFV